MSTGEPPSACALRVLVVDDEPSVGNRMVLLLRSFGYAARVARGGPEALRALAVEWPDVVLTDLSMPGMDGYELAERIRALATAKGRIRVALLSGYGGDEDRRRSLAQGLDGHFAKPVAPAILLAWLGGVRGEGSGDSPPAERYTDCVSEKRSPVTLAGLG